jgi:hypothetical protein
MSDSGFNSWEEKQFYNAYLTVWMALCLTLVLSLFLVMLDGVRRNGARLETECVAEIGLQSIMAEYHRELMRQYNLFAIDASYGTAFCSKTNVEAHLRKYLEKNLSYEDIFLSDFIYRDFLALHLERTELQKISILTDHAGGVFRRCAIEAIKDDVGLGLLEEIQEWLRIVKVNGLEEGRQEQIKSELDEEIDSYDGMEIEIEENVWETMYVDNPTRSLEEKRKEGILKLVVGEEEALSQKVLHTENLIGNRMRQDQINYGNMPQKEQTGMESLIEKFFFQEYLLCYMGRYGMPKDQGALSYQMEYVIAGNESDVDNLKSIANRICAIREVANALYLMSDEEKMTEIQVAAELVCTLITLPELTPLLEAVILLGWAYAESVYDVKSLLAGGKIPLLKDRDSWHYGLSAALGGDLKEDTQEGEGLCYEDYMRIFMMFMDIDVMTARAMDVVEADIRSTPGNALFRLDGCYEALEAYIHIGSSYGYEFEITRQKSYH